MTALRVTMLVQKIDDSDWLLSFVVRWVQALAARVDHLDVIALERRSALLPDNVSVYSMGKECGYGRARELSEFYKALGHVIGKTDVLFSHMTPRYVLTSAPLAMLHRKPQVLWFTHRQVSTELRLATLLSTCVTSAVRDSFPLATPKLRALGHGIDTEFYSPAPSSTLAGPLPTDGLPLIVYVARLMPIKRQDVLLRALATGLPARLALVGDVPAGHDATYVESLRALVNDLGIADRVTFTGGLLAQPVRDLLRQATLAVNLSPRGLFDKAALESMLVGVPTLVSNPAFDPMLGVHKPVLSIPDAPADEAVSVVASALQRLLVMPGAERQQMAAEVRANVRAAHSLDGLMDKLVAVMAQLAMQS